MKAKQLGKYIVADPEIRHGKPTFKGTRIFVKDVLEMLAEGMSWDKIIEEWRGSITKEAISEAILLASESMELHETFGRKEAGEPQKTKAEKIGRSFHLCKKETVSIESDPHTVMRIDQLIELQPFAISRSDVYELLAQLGIALIEQTPLRFEDIAYLFHRCDGREDVTPFEMSDDERHIYKGLVRKTDRTQIAALLSPVETEVGGIRKNLKGEGKEGEKRRRA